MQRCRDIGVARQRHAEERQLKPYGTGNSELHRRGALGELAFSKYLTLPMPEDWTWVGDKRRGYDVGGWQVRTARSRTGKMFIRPTDKPGQTYAFLLTHAEPYIWLVGWITIDEARELAEDGLTPVDGQNPAKYVAQEHFKPFPNIRGSFCIREEDDGVQAA